MGDLSRVNTNVAALKAFLTLNTVNDRILKSQERISTGLKINRASDNPSGYFAAKTLSRDIAVAKTKSSQIERGVNFLQTNSSKLNTVADLLLETSNMISLANSGAVSSAEKVAIQDDINQLRFEIESLMQSGVSSKIYSGFNLGELEDASISGVSVRGATQAAPADFNGTNVLANLGIDGTNINVTGTSAEVVSSLDNAGQALEEILAQNERLGSFIRRLEFEKQDAERSTVDLEASLSTIQDADLAAEQLELTKAQILQQTALSMLAQANSAPQSILVLFG